MVILDGISLGNKPKIDISIVTIIEQYYLYSIFKVDLKDSLPFLKNAGEVLKNVDAALLHKIRLQIVYSTRAIFKL